MLSVQDKNFLVKQTNNPRRVNQTLNHILKDEKLNP